MRRVYLLNASSNPVQGETKIGLITCIFFFFENILENSTAAVMLGMVGKFGVTSAYNVIYIFSAELFPTVIRNGAIGMSSVCSRIGGIIAAYLLLLVRT